MKRAFFVLAVLMGCACAVPRMEARERQWHNEKDHRWAALEVPTTGKTGFTMLKPEESGLFFTNLLDDWSGAANRVLYNGSGVAVGDYDNDGLPDAFFCGLNTPNALYRNIGGGKFQDVTKQSGLVFTNKNYRATVFADLNGDGWLELLVSTTGSGFLCFSNNQNGTFTDVTKAWGFVTQSGTIGFALADIDGNGTLDLYVVNNRSEDIRDRGQVDIQMLRGKLVVPPWFKDRLLIMDGRLAEYGEPDVFYLNAGQGQFKAVPWLEGFFIDEDGNRLTEPPRDWGLTAQFHDWNMDGLPDLYVCNDYWSPERIWVNDGKGHFRAIPKLAVRNTCASSMGLDFGDIDADGYPDILVTDMLSRSAGLRKRQTQAQTPMACAIGEIDHRPQFMRNTLLHNRGDGTFEEIANYADVPASDWSWMALFVDVDLDGYEDALIPAGHKKDVQDLDASGQIQKREASNPRGKVRMKDGKPMSQQEMFTEDKMINGRLYPQLDMPIVAFQNLGDCRFKEVTQLWGTQSPGVHHGLSFGDFDGDGDLDFVVNDLNSPSHVYRNDSPAPRVAVRLKGLTPNPQGIGAKVRLRNGAIPLQWKEIIAGGRYLCGSDPQVMFAAGAAKGGMAIEVTWRSGKTSVIKDVGPNRIYEVTEPAGAAVPQPAPAQPNPVFKDVSEVLAHTHHELPFDDFQWQPLLPKRLSQLGPGLAWYDLDADGHDELIIGTGRGGAPAVYKNAANGALARAELPPTLALPDDTTGMAAWSGGGQRMLLCGLANYETDTNTPTTIGVGWEQSKPSINTQPAIRNPQASTGPLAVADVDGDGHLDIFIGGRTAYPTWPVAVPSQIYRFDGKKWSLDADNSRLLAKLGLVTGAVWSDLDGDGWPDLVVASEWGPVRVLKNAQGKLQDATAQYGLDKFTGWWTGVSTGDFDGDGKLDIVAGNWGLNSPYKASAQRPLELYYGNLSGRGLVEVIETEYDAELNKVVPSRMLPTLAGVMPMLQERFTTFKAYSVAGVQEVIAATGTEAQKLQATTLASMVFMNRGGRFEALELPRQAQWAPVFGVNVADFDGDGWEDVFLSQNFFATQPELPRLDAGRGLWVRNVGGRFSAVPGQESGVKVYGEQRGAAVGDFNEDGRVDLVVSQNGAATKLYQNVLGKPGLRVRLVGPVANPCGIGASVRLVFGEKMGPVRELHGGSGYWSQDSLTQVLGTPMAPTKVWVRWPGGKVTTSDVPANAKEITVSAEGRVGVKK